MFNVLMVEYNTITKIILPILFWIDGAIYRFLSYILAGYFDLAVATYEIFGGNTIFGVMARRLYVVVGIFALFKLAFNLISSVIDPANFDDKERGFGKLIPRTIIALVLVLSVQKIFDIAFSVQEDIIVTIPNIILGTSGEGLDSTTYGEALAITTWKGFISANEACSDSFDDNWHPSLSSIPKQLAKKCSSNGKEFKYEYDLFIAPIAGIILIGCMFLMSFDVAMRSFKLLVLEMIAPIPIISYIDPKSSKDGMFASWSKLTIKTYLSVFIQVASVYFVVAMLTIAIHNSNASGFSLYVNLFLIIGAFLFLIQASKFVNQALGIKNEEGGFMKTAMTGLGIGATLGGIAAGGISNAIVAGKKNFSNTKGSTIKKALAGIGGGASGMFRGGVASGYAGFKAAAGGKNLFDVAGSIKQANQTVENEIESDVGVIQKVTSRLSLVSTVFDKMNNLVDKNDSVNKAAVNLKKKIDEEAVKSGWKTSLTIGGVTGNWSIAELEAAVATTEDGGSWNGIKKEDLSYALSSAGGARDEYSRSWLASVGSSNAVVQDATAELNHELYSAFGSDAVQVGSDYSEIKTVRNVSGSNSSAIKYGGDYKDLTNGNKSGSSFGNSHSYKQHDYDSAKAAAGGGKKG